MPTPVTPQPILTRGNFVLHLKPAAGAGTYFPDPMANNEIVAAQGRGATLTETDSCFDPSQFSPGVTLTAKIKTFCCTRTSGAGATGMLVVIRDWAGKDLMAMDMTANSSAVCMSGMNVEALDGFKVVTNDTAFVHVNIEYEVLVKGA